MKDNLNNIFRSVFETFADSRGEIKKIAQNVDVLSITSAKGSRRADHTHRNSSHLCYLESGRMEYYEKPTGSKVKPTKVIVEPGDYFFTDKNLDHTMHFLENSRFLCFSYGSRNKEDYENDLVRLDYDLIAEYDNYKE